jgi:Holliday junction resolvasome RuvABC endonuclease subunit
MKVLALDLSLRGTGICVLEGDPDSEPTKRHERLPMDEAKTIEEKVKRLKAIAEHIVQLMYGERPDYVIIEAAAKNQKWQAAAIGEVHGVVKLQIYLATGYIPWVKESTEMRKAVVGKIERKMVKTVDSKGKEKKQAFYGEIDGARGKKKKATIKDIIEMRLAELGLKFPSQDEMDAYVAAKYCWDKVIASMQGGSDDPKKAQDDRAESGAD